MQKVLQDLIIGDSKYQIIGSSAQVLQILIEPNEKLYTEADNIQYASQNLIIQKGNSPRLFKKSTNQVILENKTRTVAYVGLVKVQYCFNCFLISFKVKFQFLIVSSTQIYYFENQLYWLVNVSQILQKGRSGYGQFSKQSIFEGEFKKINNQNMRKQSNIYLQTEGTIIEKDLGYNESIVVRMDQIIAYDINIQSEQVKFEDFEFNIAQKLIKFIKLKGPGSFQVNFKIQGRIYYENTMKMSRMVSTQKMNNRMIIFMSFLMFILMLWTIFLQVVIFKLGI